MRTEGWETGGVYHVLNRGVDRRAIFDDDADRERFVWSVEYHRVPKPIPYAQARRMKGQPILREPAGGQALVTILCYCLMPNHFHLLIQQAVEDGVTRYMQRLLNSYTRYYNTIHERKGHLFAGPFRSVSINTDEQLLHVSRYIHLNPVVSDLVQDAFLYPWSSAVAYSSRSPTSKVGNEVGKVIQINNDLILSMISGPAHYETFVRDHAGYARELARIKHFTLAEEPAFSRPILQPSRLE